MYQTQTGVEHRYYVRGTLKDWHETIGRLCAGSSSPCLLCQRRVCGDIAEPLGLEGGGFHWVGTTSTGKTTTLYVAGSVCGAGLRSKKL